MPFVGHLSFADHPVDYSDSKIRQYGVEQVMLQSIGWYSGFFGFC